MPTRISAGVGDHPCFLIFITMNPLTAKSFTSIFAFISISWRTPGYQLVENS